MVRPDVAGTRVARATTWLNDAEALFGRPAAEFTTALKDRDLAIFYPCSRPRAVAAGASFRETTMPVEVDSRGLPPNQRV